MKPPLLDRARGALLGLAAGDALGCAVEFQPRGSFEPLTDMIGGGPHGLEAGAWTDDTSLALCLAESLVERGGFDPMDQMRRYLRWLREGYLSSTGECFDVGNTTLAALQAFERSGDPFSGPTAPRSAGNGSIMRLAPIPICFFPDRAGVLRFAAESSRTTHGAREAVESCVVLAALLHALLDGRPKEEALLAAADVEGLSAPISRIAAGSYLDAPESAIRGSGYVVESLEAALWCFHRADGFESAVLLAANLGDDADTTAAVCGQLAGAHWGVSGIPERWLERLVMVDFIRGLADALLALDPSGPVGARPGAED